MSKIEPRFKSAQAYAAPEAASANHDSALLSVVMPVHNALPYLTESIQSILNQSFPNFEFIILDDGSSDGSGQVLRQWAARDRRIRLHENKERSGLSQSSNTVVTLARAPVVARMDADDISDRQRLERQWETMQRYPASVLVGTLSEGIDSQGKLMRPRDRWRLVRKSLFPPFPHGSVMFRRHIFEEVGGYRKECVGWEDQDLFLRMAAKGPVVVLPEALYRYRYHANSATLAFSTNELAGLAEVRDRCLVRHKAGSEYVDLLKVAAARPSSDSLIAALHRAGALRLWAGEGPTVLRQIVARDDLPWSIAKLRALLWASWGTLSPESLRFVLRCLIRARDSLVSFRVKDGRLYEWRFQ